MDHCPDSGPILPILSAHHKGLNSFKCFIKLELRYVRHVLGVGTVFAYSLHMSQGMRLVRFEGDESQTIARVPSAQVELTHFRNVTNNVVQDALNVWSDIWAELEGDVACGAAVAPQDEKGFTPSCGWPEFLEKMWVLRQNLAFLSRFSRR
jgi:hypothetical protein